MDNTKQPAERADLAELLRVAANLVKWLDSRSMGSSYRREVDVEGLEACSRAMRGLIAEVEELRCVNEAREKQTERLLSHNEELLAELFRLQGLSAAGAEGNYVAYQVAGRAVCANCAGTFVNKYTNKQCECTSRACHAAAEGRV